MNRAKILEVLASEGHAALAPVLEPLIQPAIYVSGRKLAGVQRHPDDPPSSGPSLEAAMASLPLGASRFGGIPDLPPGSSWPLRDDVPMEFVAQIRLADVAGLDPLGRLPQSGTLLFFYNSQWDCSDMAPDEACCAVLFHDGPDSSLVRTPPPRIDYQGEYDSEPRLAPYLHGLAALEFKPFETVPGGVSPFTKDTPLAEIWQDFTASHSSKWAPEGEESYVSNRLLGYIDGQDYVGAHENGTADQLLLQVDSDDCAGFQWGDCDRLYFVLKKTELAARDFSKVRIYSLLG